MNDIYQYWLIRKCIKHFSSFCNQNVKISYIVPSIKNLWKSVVKSFVNKLYLGTVLYSWRISLWPWPDLDTGLGHLIHDSGDEGGREALLQCLLPPSIVYRGQGLRDRALDICTNLQNSKHKNVFTFFI